MPGILGLPHSRSVQLAEHGDLSWDRPNMPNVQGMMQMNHKDVIHYKCNSFVACVLYIIPQIDFTI